MANIRIGSHSSHNYQVAEKITEAKQLNWSDSGKVFFVEQGSGTYVIHLPKLSEEICGWQAKFVLSKINSQAVEINAYGVPAGGHASSGDANKVNYAEISATPDSGALIDGMQFGSGAADLGTTIQAHSDGTYWYLMGAGQNAGNLDKVTA